MNSKQEKAEVEIVIKTPGLLSNDFNQDTINVFNLDDEHESLIKQWIAGEEKASSIKFELLYKATRDSFSSYKMHELIDDKGPTIAIIKSNHDKVFGGYCFYDW